MLENNKVNGYCEDAELLNHMKACYRIPKKWAINEDSIRLDDDHVIARNVLDYGKCMETSAAQPLLSDYEEVFYGYDDLEFKSEEIKEISLVNYSDTDSDSEMPDENAKEEEEEVEDFNVVWRKDLKRKSLVVLSDEEEKEEVEKKRKKCKVSKFIDEEAEVEENRLNSENEDEDGEGEAIELMEIEEEKISKVFINDDEEEMLDINLYRILENSRILNESVGITTDPNCESNKAIPDDAIIGIEDIKLLPEDVQDRIKKITEAENVELEQIQNLDDMDLRLTEKQKNKFKANVRKELVKSGDDDGNCTFYSILNALFYKKTGLLKEIKDEDDLLVVDKIGKEVLDILKKYK